MASGADRYWSIQTVTVNQCKLHEREQCILTTRTLVDAAQLPHAKEAPLDAAFRVYGDNILECEHYIDWLRRDTVSQFQLLVRVGPWDRPVYVFKDRSMGKIIGFHVCPYYGGPGSSSMWPSGPLGTWSHEKPDVVVTRVCEDGSETHPLLAVEFVDAIQAGNQGWQRSRRPIDAAEARPPIWFMYVIPVIGWERDSGGLILKGPRYLPAHPCIAQLTLCSRLGVPSLQIYLRSSWTAFARRPRLAGRRLYPLPADIDAFRGVDNAVILNSLLIRSSVYGQSAFLPALRDTLSSVILEMLSVARTYAGAGETRLPIHVKHSALDPARAKEVASVYSRALIERKPVEGEFALHKIEADDFFQKGCLFYKDVKRKSIRPEFRNDVLSFLNWKDSANNNYKRRYLEAWGIDTSGAKALPDEIAMAHKSSLPVTYKESKSEGALVANRAALRTILEKAYSRLDTAVLDWVYSQRRSLLPPLFLVPLYAYKPSGDSRPDRGLLPVMQSTFPTLLQKDRTLVLVYSKHTPPKWRQQLNEGNNELWNVIKKIAGAVIVDRTGDGIILANGNC